MKHYTKSELKEQAIKLIAQINEELKCDNLIDAIRNVTNPPDREPNEVELKLLAYFDTHSREQAILSFALTQGVLKEIEDEVKASTMKAQAEDNNPEHVRVRKEAKERKAASTPEAAQSTVPPSKGKARAQAASKKKAVVSVILDDKSRPKKKTRKPQKRTKVSNYDNVDAGNCPHCILVQPFTQKTLDKDVAGKGDGVMRTCKKCGHKWYLNRKIHTCKCLTCSASRNKTSS